MPPMGPFLRRLDKALSLRSDVKPPLGVFVFFLQIDTLVLKNSSHDNHLQNWQFQASRPIGAD